MTTPADPRAWTAATVDEPRRWYYPLPDACRTVFEAVRQEPRPLTQVRLSDPHGEFTAALAPVRAALEAGRGFAVVRSPALSDEDLRLLYWLVGQGLGRPVEQNVQGTVLYDVRDTGQDPAQGARFSVTNYESSFHTDNSFGSGIVDYVGLLCLRTAKSGGRSQVVSGFAVRDALDPGVRETLGRPFHVDRRGGVREGEAATVRFSVIAGGYGEPVYRYLRYWIEAGHAKAGEPLTAAQVAALDVLDAVLNRPELRAEFDLRPGDMYFINNRWILHNRTAFEDHPKPDCRRHLVRLWLARR